jgi:hypothetical protein
MLRNLSLIFFQNDCIQKKIKFLDVVKFKFNIKHLIQK